MIDTLNAGQVELVGAAAGNESNRRRDFTYYPGMPGNSTALPAEKLQLQSSFVAAQRWQGSSVWSCGVQTLTDIACKLNICCINLLKVRPIISIRT